MRAKHDGIDRENATVERPSRLVGITCECGTKAALLRALACVFKGVSFLKSKSVQPTTINRVLGVANQFVKPLPNEGKNITEHTTHL